MVWTREQIYDICEFFCRCAEAAESGDQSYEDVTLAKLMNVFWKDRHFPVSIKESKCRAA
jgi:hypothetical protein